MSKKTAYIGLLGAAAMMSIDPRTHEMMAETRRNMQPPPKIKEPEPPTADAMLKMLTELTGKLDKKVSDWNDTSSRKLKSFDIYGYVMKGTTITNATKRLRKFQSQCSFLPGTTRSELRKENTRLMAIMNKKPKAKKK